MLKERKEIRKRLNNKGFSLVELIVVIAIMAILIGVVGTQVLPYIEKSRASKDEQVLSALLTDSVSAYAMCASDAAAVAAAATITLNKGTADDAAVKVVLDQIKELRGMPGTNLCDSMLAKFESKKYKEGTKITIVQNATDGTVAVTLLKGADEIAKVSSK